MGVGGFQFRIGMNVYFREFPEMSMDVGCRIVVVIMIVKMKEWCGEQHCKHRAHTQISRKPPHPSRT